ncbi:GntR family transcriptional regulator [Bosea thiooxidans]|nr:GntR family transcriptional regulator [Bosea sp. (in: a-proteobacteria)]
METLPAEFSQYQRVTGRLRAEIIEGVWRPDARLKVRDLAEHYGVSPAPVREALQVLQGEGLVVLEANRGARVRPIDEQVLINVFDVREALESFLAAKFALGASPHQIAMLKAIQTEHDAAMAREDASAALVLNRRFHDFINTAARNDEAVDVINRHIILTRALTLECGLTQARMTAITEEHHMLIAAFQRGDDALAHRIAASHVRSSRDDLVERLRPILKSRAQERIRSGSGAAQPRPQGGSWPAHQQTTE